MKKIYSCMLAMSIALAANASDYYLIGGFNGWTQSDPDAKFTEKLDGTYELDYQGTLTSGFKINDGTWTNPDANFGGSATLVLGEVYFLEVGGSSGNISMAENVTDPHLVFDPASKTLVVTGAASEAEYSYGLWGTFSDGKTWGKIDLAVSNGKWVAKGQEVAACTFGIKKMDKESGAQVDWISSAGDATIVLGTEIACKVEGANFTLVAGTYDFTFNPQAMTLLVSGEAGETPDDPITPPTPDDVELYLRGDMTSWAAEAGWKFTTDDKVTYTLSNVAIAAGEGFKIATEDWSVNYGGPREIALNTPVTVSADDAGNMTLAAGGENLTLTLNVETLILTVSGEGGETPDDPITPPTPGEYKELNLVGAFNGWDAAEGPKFTREENVYTLVLDEGLTGEWKICDGTWDYNFGAGEETPLKSGVEVDAWFGSGYNFSSNFSGKTTITFTLVEGSDVAESVIASKLVMTGETVEIPDDPTPGEEYAVLYLRGDMNGWGTSDQFTTTDGKIYTFELPSLDKGVGFKIADATWGDYNFGGPADIALGTTIDLQEGNTGNMSLAVNAKDVKFTLNLDELTLTIEGTENEAPVDYTTWKVSAPGEYNEWGALEGYTEGVAPNEEGIATLTRQVPGDGEFKIKVVANGAELWYSNGGTVALDEWIAIGKDSANMTLEDGDNKYYYTIKWNCKTQEINVTRDIETGVEAILTENSDAVYYNLQGVQVKNPANGLYVKVVNGKATKVFIND